MDQQKTHDLLELVKLNYEEIGEQFSKSRQKGWSEFEAIMSHIRSNDIVADIGCGNGRLRDSLPKNITYIGVDQSDVLLAQARKNYPADTFHQGSILEIPLPDTIADVTCAVAVLHHIPSRELQEKAIREMIRITKPGGYMILTVWNLWQKKYLRQHIAAWKKTLTGKGYGMSDLMIPWNNASPRYYHAFTKNELKNLLAGHLDIQRLEATKTHNYLAVCRTKTHT